MRRMRCSYQINEVFERQHHFSLDAAGVGVQRGVRRHDYYRRAAL
jgi:hypothetical protein